MASPKPPFLPPKESTATPSWRTRQNAKYLKAPSLSFMGSWVSFTDLIFHFSRIHQLSTQNPLPLICFEDGWKRSKFPNGDEPHDRIRIKSPWTNTSYPRQSPPKTIQTVACLVATANKGPFDVTKGCRLPTYKGLRVQNGHNWCLLKAAGCQPMAPLMSYEAVGWQPTGGYWFKMGPIDVLWRL